MSDGMPLPPVEFTDKWLTASWTAQRL